MAQAPLLTQTNLHPRDANRAQSWRLVMAGNRFEISLTRDPREIALAQRLRYQVFYEEMNAAPTPEMAAVGRDFDAFDDLCDHLLVYDRERPALQQVVGTYRLLPQNVAEVRGGFYSATEYDLAPLLQKVAGDGGLLELGRSCVHAGYRTSATIQLLWRGIATYMADNAINYMFGCASFMGTDPDRHALALSYLYQHHLAPEEIRVRALPNRHVPMSRLAGSAITPRAAIAALPPLIKAYLRIGAYIGDGAVIDHQFGTTDVFILLPVNRIAPKYYAHYDREEGLGVA
jgi:putative hemolysin